MAAQRGRKNPDDGLTPQQRGGRAQRMNSLPDDERLALLRVRTGDDSIMGWCPECTINLHGDPPRPAVACELACCPFGPATAAEPTKGMNRLARKVEYADE